MVSDQWIRSTWTTRLEGSGSNKHGKESVQEGPKGDQNQQDLVTDVVWQHEEGMSKTRSRVRRDIQSTSHLLEDMKSAAQRRALALVWGCQPPEPWTMNFCYSQATQFMVFCCSSTDAQRQVLALILLVRETHLPCQPLPKSAAILCRFPRCPYSSLSWWQTPLDPPFSFIPPNPPTLEMERAFCPLA